jgi:hypothetical protein
MARYSGRPIKTLRRACYYTRPATQDGRLRPEAPGNRHARARRPRHHRVAKQWVQRLREEDYYALRKRKDSKGRDLGRRGSRSANTRCGTQSRPAVTVRMNRIPEAANKSAAELLAKVKPIIPGAYAVRQLRSGDIEVAVPDQTSTFSKVYSLSCQLHLSRQVF